jgi:Nucleotidyltransferase
MSRFRWRPRLKAISVRRWNTRDSQGCSAATTRRPSRTTILVTTTPDSTLSSWFRFGGAELTRHGQPNVTAAKARITAQKLRYLDLLLDAPWSVRVGPDVGVPLDRAADLLLPNPVSFIVQKLLIPDKRPGNRKAQDVLYIHDTLELFGGALDNLRTLWLDQLRPKMPGTTAKRVETTARAMFEQVTDTIREAARIPQDRRLSPDVIRAACQYGLSEILGSTT